MATINTTAVLNASPAGFQAACVCPSTASCCVPSTPPSFIVETPRMLWTDPMQNVPFWIWIVVAVGILLAILIIILIIVLLCRGNRNCFWCCCLSDDVVSTTPIVKEEFVDETNSKTRRDQRQQQIRYRYPDDDMPVNRTESQRIGPGKQQRMIRLVEDIDEEPFPTAGYRTSHIGTSSQLVPARSDRIGGALTLVNVGGASAAAGRSSSVISGGYHSAAVQVAPGGRMVHYGGGSVQPIYPAL